MDIRLIKCLFFIQSVDKAGLKWEGFNTPIATGEEYQAGDGEGEPVQMRAAQKGWSGRTWPGRSIGSPLTADGGLTFKILTSQEYPILEKGKRVALKYIVA